MAFTLLILSLLATPTLSILSGTLGLGGISPFGTLGAFGAQNAAFGAGASALPGVPGDSTGFPNLVSPSRSRLSNMATMRAINGAGDRLLLTFQEEPSGGLPGLPVGFGGLGLPGLPFGNPLLQGRAGAPGGSDLRVHGIFLRAGSDTGIASQDSLSGVFAMVIMSNGNTAGACAGTGQPMQMRSRTSALGGLLNPLANPLGRNPLGVLGGNPFLSPLLGRQQQQQQGQVAAVSTPLVATSQSATVEGRIRNMRITDVIGRSLQLCGDKLCSVRTDMCGTIGWDNMSVEQFSQFRQRQVAVLSAQGGNALTGFNPTLGTTGVGGTFGSNVAVVGTDPADTSDLFPGGTGISF